MRSAALVVVGSLLFACGYRPVRAPAARATTGPVRIGAIDASRTHEPALADYVADELVRQLARRGVAVTATRSRSATLDGRIQPLATDNPVLAGDHLASQQLTLSATFRLRGADHRTLWRSPLIDVSTTWVRPRGIAEVERTREVALRALAAAAATRAVEAMLAERR